MNIYLLEQDENDGYDTYDSMVVMAKSAKEAQQIHPTDNSNWGTAYDSWAPSPDKVKVTLIGKVDKNYISKEYEYQNKNIICDSFNAG